MNTLIYLSSRGRGLRYQDGIYVVTHCGLRVDWASENMGYDAIFALCRLVSGGPEYEECCEALLEFKGGIEHETI